MSHNWCSAQPQSSADCPERPEFAECTEGASGKQKEAPARVWFVVPFVGMKHVLGPVKMLIGIVNCIASMSKEMKDQKNQ